MIKTLFILLFIGLSTSQIQSQNTELPQTLDSKDRVDPVYMILDDQGFITFKVEGKLLGGKGYNIGGEQLRMTYKTHTEKSKIKITITIRDLLKKEVLNQDTGTIVFHDPNNIQFGFKKIMQESKKSASNDCRLFLKIM